MRWYLSLLAFLYSAMSWAADKADAPVHNSQYFTNNVAMTGNTDTSVSLLGQVFGTVGDVLQGSSGEMLAHLFYPLNVGFSILAAGWIGFTFIMVIFRSAQEGSFMQANKQLAMLCMRVAIAAACLVPLPLSTSLGADCSDAKKCVMPAGYYSIAQMVVMKVAVLGAGFANVAWEHALDYVHDGGSVYHPPVGGQGRGLKINEEDFKSILGDPDNKNAQSGAAKGIFVNAVCMYNSKFDASAGQTPTIGVDPKNRKYLFPDGLTPDGCGSVSWSLKEFCTRTDNVSTGHCAMTQRATGNLIQHILPVAKRYVCKPGMNTPFCADAVDQTDPNANGQAFFGGFLDYFDEATQWANLASSSFKGATQFIDRAKQNGWAMAGTFYWDLAQVQTHAVEKADISEYAPSVTWDTHAEPAVLADATQFIEDAKTRLQQYGQSNSDGTASKQSPFPKDKSGIGSTANQLIASLLGGLYGLTALFAETNTSDMPTDPMIFLHNLGSLMLKTSYDIYIGLPIAAGIVALAMSVVPFMALGTTATTVMPILQAVLYPIAKILLLPGIMLTMYTPMYPFLLFLFGVIGWIIAVLEAMVAAPLICLGLTHPDGHDFAGKSEPAKMLLLGVFLRPILMIIGLVAGMILSYVAFRLIIFSFGDFMQDLFGAAHTGANTSSVYSLSWELTGRLLKENGNLLMLIAVPLLMCIFSIIVVVVTNRCFALIYILPDNILRWIGGPQSSPQGAGTQEMEQSVQGKTQGAAKTISSGAGAAAQKGGEQATAPAMEHTKNKTADKKAEKAKLGGK